MSDSGPGPYCSDGNHCAYRERITELEAQLKAAEAERDRLRGQLQDCLYCLTIWAGSEKTWSGDGLDAAKRLRDSLLLTQEGGDNE